MTIKIAELFAGVGGFREAVTYDEKLRKRFSVVWSNQWEPSEAKKPGNQQAANRVYIAKFGDKHHSTEDIFKIAEGNLGELPSFDMLVGGFPCQDYSVAKPKNMAKGIRGPKGVLWWSIEYIVRKKKPTYILLETVDRLVNSPANKRGRDFAVILKGLDDLGYHVEWRVVNAADYGFPQKRRRIFILAYKGNKASPLGGKASPKEMLTDKCHLSRALPCELADQPNEYNLNAYSSDDSLGKNYTAPKNKSPFGPAGYMADGVAWSCAFKPTSKRPRATLGSVLLNTTQDVMPNNAASFRLAPESIAKWAYAKGRKNEPRRKGAAVLKFIKTKVRGGASLPPREALSLAKRLPGMLSMDAALLLSHDGKTVSVKLAREELHKIIDFMLFSEPVTANLPVEISREQLDELLSKAGLSDYTHVVDGALDIATERAISLLGLKHDEEAWELVSSKLRPMVHDAVRSLLQAAPPIELKLGTFEVKISRDELANASFAYGYKEGGLPFPDPVKAPGRTIITSEGGASVSRFKHVICEHCASGKGGHTSSDDCIKAGKLRRLYPEELERMNGFSAVHSQKCRELKASDGRRAFFMGNALVVGVVRDILSVLPA